MRANWLQAASFTLLVLFACDQEPVFFIDARLEVYWQSFKHEAAIRGISIPDHDLVMIVDPQALKTYGGWGVSRKTGDQRYVYIDEAYFNRVGDNIELTVFHELGHALLNRKHNDGWSLMNNKVSTAAEGWPACTGCRGFLIDELFGKGVQHG